MKRRGVFALFAVALLCACTKQTQIVEPTEKETEIVEKGMTNFDYEGYTLKWEDDFNGNSLNRDYWNVELHEPGWVNAELQEYVDSEENIQVKDGKLYLYPVQKRLDDGSYYYTSGRVSTQNKEDFTYGLFEARLKVPEGKGYLPAFWLMATDENIYGQWPRCGEIDIMEILGDKTKEVHGTIHYGNPHNQSQGTYRLTSIENFTNDFHTFACEWEPGKIKWYVDGILYHEEQEWYSTTEGQGTLTYPAPFDQPFYIILNLAVGGSWVGYPDETTSFDDNPYIIDYVRVFQKESYDENVSLPEPEVVILREPKENGNYINNGDFAEDEKLTDGKDWKFLLADGGKGSATIADQTMIIASEQEGNVDYSVQLVQPDLPMQKGSTYEISFDAYASEPRTFHLAVKAPDRNWIEYFKTTTVELGTEKQTYTYEFRMGEASDANGRLEFNMGAAKSTATIYLSNVSVRKCSDATAEELDRKTILADGNHIYNGKFQEGEGHLGFWNITKHSDASISVTDFFDGRRLKIEVKKATEEGVLLEQEHLAVEPKKAYFIQFEAETDTEKELKLNVCGKEFSCTITPGKNTYTLQRKAEDALTSDAFSIRLVGEGTLFLDNVYMMEGTWEK